MEERETKLMSWSKQKRKLAEALMDNPALLAKVEELAEGYKDGSDNGGISDKDTLISGLRRMNDCGGVTYHLGRLEILSRVMDESADGGLPEIISATNGGSVVALCYWQRKIIDEIRHTLNAQDQIIGNLKRLCHDSERQRERFKAQYGKLEGLRSLANLFLVDNLFYMDEIDTDDLRSWALAYNFPFEAIKGLLEDSRAVAGEVQS